MSFRHSSLQVCCGLMAVAAVSLLPCSGQTGGRRGGRPIEYSEPRSDGVTTNLHQLSVKPGGLKEMEEDISQPTPSSATQSSLDGVAAPLPSSPVLSLIQSRRAKELLERRKNWAFMRPEDLLTEPTLDQILKTPDYGKDGRDKNSIPAFERYYDRLATKRPAASGSDQGQTALLFGPAKKPGLNDETAERDDSDLPSALKERAQELKKMFGLDTSGSLSVGSGTLGSFADPFNLGSSPLSQEQVLEHNKLMDKFNSVVDKSWRRPAAASLFNQPLGLPAMDQAAKSPAAGFASSLNPAPHTGLDAQMDVLKPMLGPAGLPDVNARALGQPRSALVPAGVEAPKVVAPTFTAPRRAF